MMMLCCTKVLRPGLPRLGKLGNNIVLPRTVDLASLLGGMGGFFVGLPVGLLIARPLFGGMGVLGAGMIGIVLGLGAVQWKPWKGEHLGRVAITRGVAAIRTRPAVCPGSSRLPIFDEVTGRHACATCGLMLELEDGLSPQHQWRRRFFVGVQEVAMPQTGPMVFVAGSVPIERSDL